VLFPASDATTCPSGENSTPSTNPPGPLSVCSRVPSATRHRLMPHSVQARIWPSGENAKLHTLPECAFSSRSRVPSTARHSRTLPLDDPDAMICPSGENAKQYHCSLWAKVLDSSLPSDIRHISTLPSDSPQVRSWPSAEKAMLLIHPVSISCSMVPSDTRQRRIILSPSSQQASVWPSGENTTFSTELVCPSRVCSRDPSETRHSATVGSSDAPATIRPSGENATASAGAFILRRRPPWSVAAS
jgi:hypothetical protein